MKATYEYHAGSDLDVVNAARVSFGKRSEELSKQDERLIAFLARGCTSGDWEDLLQEIYDNIQVIDGEWAEWYEAEVLEDTLNHIRKMPPHWSPFAHTAITLHLKMPIFVARQVMKHTTGMVYNEVSRRYVDDEPEFYVPDVWRKRAGNVKQGSSDEDSGYGVITDYLDTVKFQYQNMLAEGVAPEQARMVLPQSMYTEVIATGNLYSWANMYIQRTDKSAQKETKDLLLQVGDIIEPLFPVSWKELTK